MKYSPVFLQRFHRLNHIAAADEQKSLCCQVKGLDGEVNIVLYLIVEILMIKRACFRAVAPPAMMVMADLLCEKLQGTLLSDVQSISLCGMADLIDMPPLEKYQLVIFQDLIKQLHKIKH